MLARYLKTVAFLLPGNERADILAELESDLATLVEEREGELGRALDPAEMQALLDRHGKPARVAGRYLPQRQLIGPELFPLYRLALKAVLLAFLLPWFLVWLGFVCFSPGYRAEYPGLELLGTLATLGNIAVYAFAALTLGFALLERVQARPGLRVE